MDRVTHTESSAVTIARDNRLEGKEGMGNMMGGEGGGFVCEAVRYEGERFFGETWYF